MTRTMREHEAAPISESAEVKAQNWRIVQRQIGP